MTLTLTVTLNRNRNRNPNPNPNPNPTQELAARLVASREEVAQRAAEVSAAQPWP